MDFDFNDEQRLLQKTAQEFLRERCPLERGREVVEGKRAWDAELWEAIAQLGWLGVALPEEFGGAGFGYLELALVAESLGSVLAPLPFLPSVALATEALRAAGSPEQQRRDLPRLAAGEVVGTLVEGTSFGRKGRPVEFDGTRLSGSARTVPAGAVATHAVVAAHKGGALVLAWVDLTHDSVSRAAVEAIDPTRACADIAFDSTPAELLGNAQHAAVHLETILDRAAVLLAFEQLGGAARAFEITKAHALQRHAFGRPIGSFQALKHRLVDVYAAIELARSNAYFGAWALTAPEADLGIAASAARVSATAAYELAATEMIQMHGGMGFTWEADCHLFYRRAKADAILLGSRHHWRERLVQRLEHKEGQSHELR